jgi:hypothetical protein
MTKESSMGKEYSLDIVAAEWNQIANVVRATKDAVLQSRSLDKRVRRFQPLLRDDNTDFEDGTLREYLVPDKGESFEDYQKRLTTAFLGGGFATKIARLMTRKDKCMNICWKITQNEGESILALQTKSLQPTEYKITIRASGIYEARGNYIAEKLRDQAEQNMCTINEFQASDRMLTY